MGLGLAQNKPLEVVLEELGEVAEGVKTTNAIVEIARKYGIYTPIASELALLLKGKSVLESMNDLIRQRLKGKRACKDFSSLLLKLQEYWKNQGCLVIQPYDIPARLGHSTATLLRSLDKKPWNVAYVAPSRRPTDGRYGENPNRLGSYYQFQVVIKPSPSNIQELYLKSLEVLGINLNEHDIRFVEDNWESPTLGAWGLGWEVWLDGMEVTQFTYFQQVGAFLATLSL